ncbi:MAG: ribosome biogenesis GTPase YlqF [Bacillota bacterium]|nr:ribosome biogenesis GTPase YlqF [Bacillota bacterium]
MKEGQWYPGNMARAVTRLRQDIKIVDLVVELLDARIPKSSHNPSFAGLVGGKKHLILLHKADRAEDAATESWLSYFNDTGKEAMAFSVHNKFYLTRLLRHLKKEEQNIRSGRLKRPLRMIIVGIPNVGKSTMINYFVNKSVTKTGNQPGVTRGRQWIRITPGLELLDTPGILWPKIDEETSWPLAVVGAIPPSRIDIQQLAQRLIAFYLERGKEKLIIERYSGVAVGSAEKMLADIGLLHGCLLPEGKVDLDRSSALLLHDFQGGLLGQVTLEFPQS